MAIPRYLDALQLDLQYALAYNSHCAPSHFYLARLLQNDRKVAEARQEAEEFLREWQNADPGVPELAAARAIAGR